MNKRQWIIAGLALLVTAGVGGGLYFANRAVPPPITASTAEVIGADELHVMGDPAAKVTLIEYAALACPFCAAFNNTIVPALKEKYVATGKVRYVLRLIAIDIADAKAEGLATCMGKDKFDAAVDLLYRRQDEWGPEKMGEHGVAPDAQPKTDAGLTKIGRTLGLDEAKIFSCLRDSNALDRLQRTAEHGGTRYGLTGTPTLIVNGQIVTTPRSPEDLAKILDPLLEGN